jgi:uncharacterized protein
MSTTHWPWWLGALALGSVAALVPLLLRRGFGVSGLVRTALLGTRADALPRLPAALFLVGITGGAAISALAFGAPRGLDPTWTGFFGDGPLALTALVGGGALVGAGTRVAGGCTSGHGLSGTARLQPGSLAATASFFGTGVVVSLVLAWVLV